MTWSPTQYTKFEDERTRPVRDLVAQIPNRDVALAADVGCGPGNSTEVLLGRYPAARITGMDSSPEMIAAARKRLPALAFEVADVSAWTASGPFDVILSNAVLQWVPNHDTLLPALVSKLAPGGSLAVQLPESTDEPAHQLMRDIAKTGPWAAKLANASKSLANRRTVDWYWRTLKGLCGHVDLWQTTYHHNLMGGPAAIVEWFKSTGLRPYLGPLDEGEQKAFLESYLAALTDAYPTLPDGSVRLPFPRLFFVATR